MATQNPIEQEGTYQLPEAQLDRFLLHVHVDYPSLEEERQIVDSVIMPTASAIEPVASADELEQALEARCCLRSTWTSACVLTTWWTWCSRPVTPKPTKFAI